MRTPATTLMRWAGTMNVMKAMAARAKRKARLNG
jgi:hypothetical protein